MQFLLPVFVHARKMSTLTPQTVYDLDLDLCVRRHRMIPGHARHWHCCVLLYVLKMKQKPGKLSVHYESWEKTFDRHYLLCLTDGVPLGLAAVET